MHSLLSLSVLLLSALTLTAASPAPISHDHKRDVAPTQQYYLRTSLVPGSNGSSAHDGLYLEAYHTGAGLNDAVLVANKTHAAVGRLNGTYQEFTLGESSTPYGLYIEGDTNYAAWDPAVINAGNGTAGYFLNATGLQWNSSSGAGASEFAGWIALSLLLFLFQPLRMPFG
ncbi:MAG: hypothetical protein M1819_006394 [Sarea resinae]|nr:MAG: hypothetical protein M1819_006394 [Sarea resinae]